MSNIKSSLSRMCILSLIVIAGCAKKTDLAGSFPTQFSQLSSGLSIQTPPQEISGSDAVPVKGIVALKSAWLRYRTKVSSDVTVLGHCNGNSGLNGCLDSNAELIVGVNTVLPSPHKINADSIRVKKFGKVLGIANANNYSVHSSATIASRNSPMASVPNLPPFLTGTAGTANIQNPTVALLSGQFKNFKLTKGKAAILAGGFYQFKSIDLDKKASLICATDCTVTVENRLMTDKGTSIIAQSNNPNDLKIYVAGKNAENAVQSQNAAVDIGKNANVVANIYAPNGTLYLGTASIARGVFIGRWVRIEHDSVVTGGELPPGYVKLFEAGTPGAIEVPGQVKLVVPGCALAEDAIISIIPKNSLGAGKVNPLNLKVHSGMQYEMQPSGLSFNCPAGLTLNYDTTTIMNEGGDVAKARVWTSQDDVLYYPVTSQQITANATLHAEINHFTFFVVASFPATGNFVFNVDKLNQYDYVSNWLVNGGLTVFDATNPAAPTQISNTNIGTTGCTDIGAFYSLARMGNYVYMSQFCDMFPVMTEKLFILDVGAAGTLAAPINLGSVNFPVPIGGARRLVKSGSSLFTVGSDGSNNSLVKISLSTPTAPVFTTAPLVNPAAALAVDSGFIYVPQAGDIAVYDTASLTLQTIFNGFSTSVTEVQVSNNRLYVVDNMGNLAIAALTTPTSISGLQTFSVANPAGLSVSSMEISLGRILIGGGITTPVPFGSRVLAGYTDNYPVAPTLVDSIVQSNSPIGGGQYEQLKVNGNFTHTAASAKGYEVLDISSIPSVPAPAVVAITPADASTGVATNSAITVTFSTAMNPALMTTTTSTSCSTGLVHLSADNFATCIPMSTTLASMSGGNTVATFSPSGSLANATTYRVRVRRFVQSADGFNLAADVVQPTGWTTQNAVTPTGWYSVASGVSSHLNSVAFVPATMIGFAVGDGGVVLRSGDNGETWANILSGIPSQTLNDVVFYSSTEGLIAGSTGIFKISNASGAPSFTDITNDAATVCSGIGPYKAPVAVSATTYFVVCGRVVLRSLNAGVNWSISFIAGSGTGITGQLVFQDNLNGIFWTSGLMFKTTDGGVTWVQNPNPAIVFSGFSWDMLYLTNNNVILGGNLTSPNGIPLRVSSDGGGLFTAPSIPSLPTIQPGGSIVVGVRGLSQASATNLFAVGYNNSAGNQAMILFSNDTGFSWVQQASPVATTLMGVNFATANLGLAVGQNGVILKTQTGGF